MCLQCHTKLPKRAAIECICRRVRFCSPACQQLALSANGRHADCTGAPEAKIDLGQVSQRAANEVPTSHYEQWQAEYYRTVLEPAKRGGIRSATVEEYIRVAEKGNGPANVAAAYMAGVTYTSKKIPDKIALMLCQPHSKIIFKQPQQCVTY